MKGTNFTEFYGGKGGIIEGTLYDTVANGGDVIGIYSSHTLTPTVRNLNISY